MMNDGFLFSIGQELKRAFGEIGIECQVVV
jgi:hypothetical protein